MKNTIVCVLCLLIFVVPGQSQDMNKTLALDNVKASPAALLSRAAVYRQQNQPDSALLLAYKAFTISQTATMEESRINALMMIAFCYQDKGDYKKSMNILRQAYRQSGKVLAKNKQIAARLYNGLGGTSSMLGNNDSAIHYYFKALDVLPQDSANEPVRMRLYNNIGVTWSQQAFNDKAIIYLKKALQLAIKQKDTAMQGDIYSGLGLAYVGKNNTALASHYLTAAKEIYLKKPSNKGLQVVYINLGRLQGKDYPKAILYYNEALKIDTVTAIAAVIYQCLGESHYHLGHYKQAEQLYLKAEAICNEQGLYTHRLANYSILSLIYAHNHQYEKAYLYQKRYAVLNDSLLNTEKLKVINRLETAYRSAEKDTEIADNKLQIYKQQRWILLTALTLIILLAVFLVVYFRIRHKQRLQRQLIINLEQQKKIEHLHSKMQGEEEERSRIARELHDGVNVLLSATKMNYASLGKEYAGLPATRGYGEVMQLLNDMGTELRTITYKLVPELLIRQSLPDAIDTFCELIQKGNNLHIELQTYGSFTALPAECCFGIYRIVQELVHNIVKHSAATQVLIQLRYQDDTINLTVEDNGKGFDPAAAGKGLGLKSIKSRVHDLNGRIGFHSQPGIGTSIEIEILPDKTMQ